MNKKELQEMTIAMLIQHACNLTERTLWHPTKCRGEIKELEKVMAEAARRDQAK